MTKWGIYEAADGRPHVMPCNDAKLHRFADCWCEPYDEGGVMVHNVTEAEDGNARRNR